MSKRSETSAPRKRIRLVVFDMDGVLIDHVSSWAAVHDALGTENEEAVRAFHEGRIDDREFIMRDVRLWRRARPDFDAREMRRILTRIPRMPGMKEAVEHVRRIGAVPAIISGGLRTMADILAREAQIDHIYANDVVFGKNGRLVDDAVVDVPLRRKEVVLQGLQTELGIPIEQTVAIGDSAFDVGLFRRSTRSIAFNPLDAGVADAATVTVTGKDLRPAVAAALDGTEDSG